MGRGFEGTKEAIFEWNGHGNTPEGERRIMKVTLGIAMVTCVAWVPPPFYHQEASEGELQTSFPFSP